jgi:CheY-like chemotaxis protein
MPGMGGIEAARRIRADGSAEAVALISSDADDFVAGDGDGEVPAVMSKRQLRPATLTSLWERVRASA